MQKKVEIREHERDVRERENAEFEKRKHAEQVAAWLYPAGDLYEDTVINIVNHSQFPVWSVVINHEAFGHSETVIYPTMVAGSEISIPVGTWAMDNYSAPNNLLLPSNVRITFVDINGRTWQRPAGDVPLLREVPSNSQ